jgi:hypothetical protein
MNKVGRNTQVKLLAIKTNNDDDDELSERQEC